MLAAPLAQFLVFPDSAVCLLFPPLALQARNMRGIKSHGMLLAASNEEHTEVEPLAPPEGAAVGERVWFGEANAQQVRRTATRRWLFLCGGMVADVWPSASAQRVTCLPSVLHITCGNVR